MLVNVYVFYDACFAGMKTVAQLFSSVFGSDFRTSAVDAFQDSSTKQPNIYYCRCPILGPRGVSESKVCTDLMPPVFSLPHFHVHCEHVLR